VGRDTSCPRCGAIGRVVADETILAILKPENAGALLGVERRFCKTPACEVLYYGADGRLAPKTMARVRVGVKEVEDPAPLCYCFGFSRADIRRQVRESGLSDIPALIAAEVKAGRCSCETKNPSGACCLGDVRRAVQDALGARSPSPGSGEPEQPLSGPISED
jgi:Zinc binding domain